MSKSFELNLPVYKRGDDLANCIDQAKGNLQLAFEIQSEAYTEAARLCTRMAGAAAEMPEMRIDADTHMINVSYEGVDGSNAQKRLESLVSENVLSAWDDHEDDEEDEEEED